MKLNPRLIFLAIFLACAGLIAYALYLQHVMHLEPCPMCMGAILWCGFGRVVYAASIEQIATRLHQIAVSSAELRAKAPFVAISITGGVLADDAMALFPK